MRRRTGECDSGSQGKRGPMLRAAIAAASRRNGGRVRKMALDSNVSLSTTSPAQDDWWYLSQVDGYTPAIRFAHQVTGPLDLEALRDAWRVLADRHEALRTTLIAPDGVPLRRISAEAASALRVVAGTEPGAAGLDDGVRLDTGPPVRLTAVAAGPGEHLLVLAAQRAVVDHGSAAILLTELSECYNAIVAGRRPALPPLPAEQYTDFARWQRDRVEAPEARRALDWWTSALTPPPPPLNLPTDRPDRDGPAGPGGVLEFAWDGVGSAVSALAESEDTTDDVVLLAAFQVLLHRLSGAARVSVGMPVDIRRPADAGQVGVFENLVVLGADFADGPAFGAHLRRVAATARTARANADVPFDRVVRAVCTDRDPRRTPLVDAVLVPAARPPLRLAGTEVHAVAVDHTTVTADLTLTVHRVGDAVTGSLAYRASLFGPDAVRRLLDQLHTLLAAALDRPDRPVGDLPLVPPARLRAATRAADLTTGAGSETIVSARIHAFAEAHPDAPAVSLGDVTMSYGELVAAAGAVTRALLRRGPVDGAAVAVRLPQGAHQVAALLGVVDAGAHLVCFGTGDAGERGRAVLADLRPVCLLVHGDAGDDDLAGWFRDDLGGRVLDTGDLGEPGAVVPVRARPDARAYVAYTSGSTGRPKGIPTTHASLAQFVGWFAGEFGIGPGSRLAQWAAAGYDAALVETFAALTAGATLCLVPDRIRAHPEKMAGWLATERITAFQTVPTFAREILKAVAADDAAGSLIAVDHLLLAGEALPGELANAARTLLPGARLVNLYGSTETILATWHEVTGETAGVVPIGRPIPGRQVLVLDDQDSPCPTGVTGQIVVLSPYVTSGYTGAAAGERAAFEPPTEPAAHGIAPVRCYRTGDLGRRRWDGSLEFLGRQDLQVKFQGVRVELTDLETALAGCESVAECAVTAVAGADGLVSRLVAHVVPARDETGAALGSAGDWRAALRARFGRSKYPLSFHTVLGLPRNLGGKVDRRLLQAPATAAAAAGTPWSTVDNALAAVWSGVLGAAPAGADENFFTVGGHSLLVPVLLSRIRERVGIEVPVREFLADPTIAGLSARSGSPSGVQPVPETRIG
ncbi:AMP-binding protein [Amycolatopsis sp. NPDC005961]|uniref:non-ribosomal peptide synthetase n=1 Tax=Amycolatopsis sp. NPDC005961 TaxID=3156720 RepID=UPI0033CA07C1